MRVAILGRTKMLYDSIEKLQYAGHQIVLIGTCRAQEEYDVDENDFKIKAEEIGCDFFCDSKINSQYIVEKLFNCNADIAVSMNWLTVVGEEACGCFRLGILNAHCGDLPRYRGNACPNWAILRGEKSFAISIHYMEPNSLDSGDILVKEKYAISEETRIGDIYKIMHDKVPEMFVVAVSKAGEQSAEIIRQSRNPQDSLRCYPRVPNDGFIDWTDTTENILRIIKASGEPFAGAFSFCDGKKIVIHDAVKKPFSFPCCAYTGQIMYVDKEKHIVGVGASDGIIEIEDIMVEDEKMKADDYFKSTRKRFNYFVQPELYALNKKIERLTEMVHSFMADR